MKFKYCWLFILFFVVCIMSISPASNAERAYTKNGLPKTTGIDDYSYWYSRYLNSVKVGYSHETRRNGNLDGQPVIITTSDSTLKIKRMESVVESKDKVSFYETTSGKPLKFVQESVSGESESTKLEGIVHGDKVELISTTYGNVSKNELLLSERVIFPYAIDRKYQQNSRRSFKYSTLMPDLGASMVKVEVDYLATEPTDILGEEVTLNKYEVKYDALPSLFVHEWRDDNGVLYKTTLSLMKEAHFLVSEEEAKIIDTRRQVDVIEDSMVVTDMAIPDPRDVKSATYVIKVKKGDFNNLFIEDNRQKIVRESLDELYLEVNAYLPEFLLYNFPFTSPIFKAYLKDNNYIQPSHPGIKTKAYEIVGKQKNAFLSAKALEKWVGEKIKTKTYDVGLATASDTLKSGKGDCTEHAVLLASMLRAIGIPAQVVVGLVYVPVPGSDKGSFVFHMWTEAYVGEWIQLDAALPSRKVADAARIELAKSTMNNPEEVGKLLTSPVSIIGNLEIEILNYISYSTGHLDITNQATSVTKQYDLSELIASGQDYSKIPLQSINLDQYKEDKGIVTKYNITGLPNTSPILESYSGYFTKGMAVYAKGNIEKSILYFKKAASLIRKNDAKTYFDMGVRLNAIMMFDLAREQFNKAIALDDELWSGKAKMFLENKFPKGNYDKTSEIYNMTGFSYANFASNYPAALLMYEKAIDESPEFDSALYNLGTIYSFQGEFDKALEDFEKAARINPKNPLIFAGIGEVYEQLGDNYNALQNYERVIQIGSFDDPNFIEDIQFRIAKIKAREAIAANPDNANAYLQLGEAAFNNEQFSQAKKAFIKALNINKNIAKAHTGLGDTYLQLGDPLYAEEEYKRALKLNSRDPEAYKGLSTISKRRLAYPEAISYIKKSIALAPKNYKYYIDLGKIYLDMEDYNKAVQEFTKATNAEGYYWLGLTYQLSNQEEKAKSYFLKSIATNPYDARPYKSLGKIYIDEDELFDARDYLEDAVGLDTNYADAYFLLGIIDEIESDKIGAANNFVISYSIDPTSVEAYKKAYYIFEEEGELDKFFLPRPKFVPNKQEREYIVKLIYLEAVRIQDQIDFLTVVLNRCKFGLNAVSADLEGLQYLKAGLAKLLSQIEGLYNTALKLEPPPRFVDLHTQYLEALWWQSNSLHKRLALQQLGLFDTNKKAQELRGDVLSTSATANEKLATFDGTFLKMINQWDPISIDEIFESSGFDPQLLVTLEEKNKAVMQRTQETWDLLMNTGVRKVN